MLCGQAGIHMSARLCGTVRCRAGMCVAIDTLGTALLSEWAFSGPVTGNIAPPWHDRRLNYLNALRAVIELG